MKTHAQSAITWLAHAWMYEPNILAKFFSFNHEVQYYRWALLTGSRSPHFSKKSTGLKILLLVCIHHLILNLNLRRNWCNICSYVLCNSRIGTRWQVFLNEWTEQLCLSIFFQNLYIFLVSCYLVQPLLYSVCPPLMHLFMWHVTSALMFFLKGMEPPTSMFVFWKNKNQDELGSLLHNEDFRSFLFILHNK